MKTKAHKFSPDRDRTIERSRKILKTMIIKSTLLNYVNFLVQLFITEKKGGEKLIQIKSDQIVKLADGKIYIFCAFNYQNYHKKYLSIASHMRRQLRTIMVDILLNGCECVQFLINFRMSSTTAI